MTRFTLSVKPIHDDGSIGDDQEIGGEVAGPDELERELGNALREMTYVRGHTAIDITVEVVDEPEEEKLSL